MAYPLAWDLIRWARGQGAVIFDFGGISAGTAESDDPLGGISDFKRRFTDRVERVGEEWVYEPHPARAQLARWTSRAGALRPGSGAT
jgi:lipid II:glycine glycyltransferase (peptidoglycan interpeptide bridge formation enzyme)